MALKLNLQEKAPYEDKAAKLKAEYNKTMNAYNKQVLYYFKFPFKCCIF